MYFKIFPNKIMPTQIPRAIGNKNLKLDLKFLKKFNMQFSKGSYIPNITHNTPLLIPGKIAPAPMAIPLKKSNKKCK